MRCVSLAVYDGIANWYSVALYIFNMMSYYVNDGIIFAAIWVYFPISLGGILRFDSIYSFK